MSSYTTNLLIERGLTECEGWPRAPTSLYNCVYCADITITENLPHNV